MKFLLFTFLFFLIPDYSGATVIRPYASLNTKSTTYEFGGPEPLNLIRVKFIFEEKEYPLTLFSIEIISGSKKYFVNKSDFGNSFRPKMDEVNFYYKTSEKRKGNLSSFWIDIPYGKKEFIDCGIEGRVSTYKKKKIFVGLYNPPEIQEDRGRYKHCKALEEIKNNVAN